jgi:hypothetical protein
VKYRFAIAASAVTLFLASPAQSGTITVDFDLSNSIISILGGILTIPPDGSITASTASVTIQGNSITTPVPGPASMSNLSLQATINGTVGAIATLTGNVTGTQVGAAAGVLTGGLANLAINTLTLNLSALINCAPAGPCAILGTFPISVMSLTPIPGVGNLGVGGLGTFGNGTLNAILSITIGGNSALITLVGQEVSRTFTPSVPEPGTFGMFGLGMLGLAAIGWRRSRS